MISRVAESCCWLHRYMERADNTARMADVNLSFVLDGNLELHDGWRPLLVVAGEQPRFLELHGATGLEDDELVQHYLIWDDRCPVSILSSVRGARENARTIRETISREMWESVNSLWLWLNSATARRLYERDRSEFYAEVERAAMEFRGITSDSMLLEEPVDFMRLGVYLERAGMTARILDVRHHALVGQEVAAETARDFALLSAILKSCGAVEGFFKRGRSLSGREVAAFLLSEPAHPRSIVHALSRAHAALARIRAPVMDRPSPAAERLAELQARVDDLDARTHSVEELHEALTFVIDTLARIFDSIDAEFFGPPVEPELSAVGSEA